MAGNAADHRATDKAGQERRARWIHGRLSCRLRRSSATPASRRSGRTIGHPPLHSCTRARVDPRTGTRRRATSSARSARCRRGGLAHEAHAHRLGTRGQRVRRHPRREASVRRPSRERDGRGARRRHADRLPARRRRSRSEVSCPRRAGSRRAPIGAPARGCARVRRGGIARRIQRARVSERNGHAGPISRRSRSIASTTRQPPCSQHQRRGSRTGGAAPSRRVLRPGGQRRQRSLASARQRPRSSITVQHDPDDLKRSLERVDGRCASGVAAHCLPPRVPSSHRAAAGLAALGDERLGGLDGDRRVAAVGVGADRLAELLVQRRPADEHDEVVA